jgi:hypothetical protein
MGVIDICSQCDAEYPREVGHPRCGPPPTLEERVAELEVTVAQLRSMLWRSERGASDQRARLRKFGIV